jgi:hypothetical protein
MTAPRLPEAVAHDRRNVLALSSMIGLALMTRTAAAATPAKPSLIPPVPQGNPGDFDFLTGEWRIHNRFLEKEKWIEFPGEATVHAILKGVGSVEELRIPARDFSGMGLRLLDVTKRVWSDHWVNAKSGVVGVPGQIGGFKEGTGTFYSEDSEGERPMLYRGVWDEITTNACRWHQGWSDDAGKTWHQTWVMHWTRAG